MGDERPGSGQSCENSAGPTFSVIVACYNAAPYVRDAIISALGQTQPPLEVIVCDDASTDDSALVLAEFGASIKVVRHERNLGEAAARNTALRAARGEFISVLDADDEYHPNRLRQIGELLAERPSLDIVTTDAVLKFDGVIVAPCYGGDFIFPTTGHREEILRRNFVFGLVAVRRSRMLAIGGYDESIRFATDWDCWIRLIHSGSEVAIIADHLATYRLHETSTSTNRLLMVEAGISILQGAIDRGGLTERELAVARASMVEIGLVVDRESMKRELLERGAVARHAWNVASSARQPLRSRVIAAAVVVVPSAVRWLYRRETRLRWRGPGNIRLRRTTTLRR